MLDEEQIAGLLRTLRERDRSMSEDADPGRDTVRDEQDMRSLQHRLGRYVASDYVSRDQLDVLGKHFDIDPDRLKSIDIMDFFLLEYEWLARASEKEVEDAITDGQSFESMLEWEETKLMSERYSRRLGELLKLHGVKKAFEILRSERRLRGK